jgi:Membrane protein involved in the export of O-antigen and teichoic acid
MYVAGCNVMTHEARFALRVRNIGWNTIYQIGSQVAPALAAIAAIPFLLRHLGSEVFGIITIFSTALLYFTMLDLGLGRAATRFIAQSMERGRWDDLRRYFWSSIVLLSGMGVVVGGICLLGVSSFVTAYLKIPPNYSHAASISFYILCLTLPVVTLTSTLRGFLEASDRFLYISIVGGCIGVCTYVLPALAVLLGGGLITVAVVFASVRLAMCAALAIGCLRIEGRPSLRPIFDLAAVRQMLAFGGWLSVSNIVGSVMIYCDRFFIGICVGMSAVASYGMPLDVIGRLQILISSFCAVLFPVMSRLDESRSPQFQSVYRGAVAVGLSLMTLITTAGVVAAPTVMKFWLGDHNTSETIFAAQVFLAGALVQSVASIAWTALHARGRSDLTAWIHLAEFPLYLVAFYWATIRFGVRGAALVWLARGIVDFLCMVIALRVQRVGSGFSVPPEVVAAIVSLGALSIVNLPLAKAAAIAALLCILAWVWTWGTLVDPAAKTQLTMLLRRWRNSGATYQASGKGEFRRIDE